jgi:hypothetical protein
MAHEPNYIALAILYFAPSTYFLIREFFFVMDGYKFCLGKGITIGLVPGIGHLAAVADFFLLFRKNKERHLERSKDSCR